MIGARLKSILAILAAAAAVGCSARSKVEQKRASLQDAAERYAALLRWNEFDRAAAYLSEDRRSAFLTERDRNADRIVDYRIVDVAVDKGSERGTVTLWLSLYRDPSMIVKKRYYRQTWEERNGFWQMVSEDPAPPE